MTRKTVRTYIFRLVLFTAVNLSLFIASPIFACGNGSSGSTGC